MLLFFLTESEKETQRQRNKSNVCIYNRKSPNRDTARERQRDKSNMCLCIRKSRARVEDYSSSLHVLHIVVCLIPKLSKSQEEASSKKKVLQRFNRSFLDIVLLL